jgi:hypothetical protein
MTGLVAFGRCRKFPTADKGGVDDSTEVSAKLRLCGDGVGCGSGLSLRYRATVFGEGGCIGRPPEIGPGMLPRDWLRLIPMLALERNGMPERLQRSESERRRCHITALLTEIPDSFLLSLPPMLRLVGTQTSSSLLRPYQTNFPSSPNTASSPTRTVLYPMILPAPSYFRVSRRADCVDGSTGYCRRCGKFLHHDSSEASMCGRTGD